MKLTINGKQQEYTGEDDRPLLWYLREDLKLTGTKFGCGVMACGACTVLVDGQPVRACMTPAASLEGKKITTIEGLDSAAGKAVQKAWAELDVVAVRLVPVRPDHGGDGASDRNAEAERPADHRRHDRQCLPLRHLHTYPRRRCARLRDHGVMTMAADTHTFSPSSFSASRRLLLQVVGFGAAGFAVGLLA